MVPSLNTSQLPRRADAATPPVPGPLFAATFGATGADATSPANPASFSNLLEKTTTTLDALSEQRKKAEQGAAGLVANALILPILKQLRRSTFGENPVFSGGNGEKTFGPQFDMELADRIAQSPNLGIKNALADRMMKKAPKPAAAITHKGLDVHG